MVLIVRNVRFMAFLGIVMSIGWVRAVMTFWLTPYLHVSLKMDPKLVALCTIVRVVSEVLIFYFGKPLTAAIGAKGMLAVCQIAGILRLAAYGWINLSGDRWYLSFVFELLKGVSAAAFTASAIELANYLVTGTNKRATLIPLAEAPREEATAITSNPPPDPATEKLRQESRTLAQGCLYGAYNGLSSTVAGLTGRFILKYCTVNEDIVTFFRIATVVALVSFAIYVLLIIKSR